VPLVTTLSGADGALPLLAARRPDATDPRWSAASAGLARNGRGLSLALHQPPEFEPADVFGLLVGTGGALPDPAFAVEAVQHPESRLRGRVLR